MQCTALKIQGAPEEFVNCDTDCKARSRSVLNFRFGATVDTSVPGKLPSRPTQGGSIQVGALLGLYCLKDAVAESEVGDETREHGWYCNKRMNDQGESRITGELGCA